jgi:hypothetical protein
MKSNNINNKSVATLVINSSILAAHAIGCGEFAHIEYDGIEKLPKKLGIVGEVTKHAEGCVQMRYSYESAVNNRLQKQGDERTFVAQSLPFGEWFIPNLLIAHKGEMFIRCYTFKGGNIETTYFVNGRAATTEETALIKAYKAQRSANGSNTQSAEGLTENQVRPMSIKVANLIALDCGSYHYRRSAESLAEANAAAESAASAK